MQQSFDDIVADTERMRFDQSAKSDRKASERRPPHPVDWQSLEQILDLLEQCREQA
ncbi:hypothetical protein ABIE33_005656 [Ensifer sp. 4252]